MDPEYYEGIEDLIPVIMTAYNLIDGENATYAQLPFTGGYYEQPAATMALLNIFRGAYIEYLREVKN